MATSKDISEDDRDAIPQEPFPQLVYDTSLHQLDVEPQISVHDLMVFLLFEPLN
jgi:hypothetical protein